MEGFFLYIIFRLHCKEGAYAALTLVTPLWR
jgi:hypothetical protein